MAGETGFLDEVTKVVGSEDGQPGMLKPGEVEQIERETGRPFQEALGAEPPPKPAGDKGGAPPAEEEFNYEELLAKVEKGETLTADEQAEVAVMRKDLEDADKNPPEQKPTSFTIGDKQVSREEITKLVRDEYKLGELDISEQAMDKMIDRYVKSENRTNQSRVTQQRSDAVAAEMARLQEQHRQNKEEAGRIKWEKEKLARDKQQLTTLANDPITEEGVYDIVDDPNNAGQKVKMVNLTKQRQYFRKLEAQERLQTLQQQEQEIKDNEVKITEKLAETEIQQFVTAHPQYKPETGELYAIYKKVLNNEQVSEADEIRIRELDDLIIEARQKQTSLEGLFRLRKAQGKLAVREAHATPSGKPPLPDITKAPKSLAEMIRRHREIRESMPPNSRGGPGDRRTPAKSPAMQLIEESRHYACEKPDSFLKELNYGGG